MMAALVPTVRWHAVAVPCGLLAAFLALCASAIPDNSATYDETAYVPAGWSYLARGDFRLSPEHPPLLKALAALPALALHPTISPEAETAYSAAIDRIDAQWVFGDRFLYRDNAFGPILHPARFVVACLGVALGAVIFLWSRALFGLLGATLSTALYAFDPSFLAHAGLATTDVGTALFFAVALVCAWRYSLRARMRSGLGCALCCAGACASKFSAVLLLASLALVFAARCLSRRTGPCGRGASLGLLALLAAASWGGIWAAYGFRYRAAAEPGLALPLPAMVEAIANAKATRRAIQAGAPAESLPARQIAQDAAQRGPGLEGRMLELAARHRLLPESYLFGLGFAASKAQARRSYLLGERDALGSSAYFPIAFGVKTPIPTLLAFLGGLGAALTRRRYRSALAFTLLPAIVICAAAIGSNLNIGHRHLLPAYPLLFVLAGALGPEVARLRRMLRLPVIALLAACGLWLGVSTLKVHPHLLSYFNEVAGGPRAGHRWLLDSNLDWGQALPALRRWMERNDVAKVNLLYFGTADPAAYGIDFVSLPGSPYLEVPGAGVVGRKPEPPLLPGYVAVSATHLHGVYLSERLRGTYAFLLDTRPVAVLGNAIFVYDVERWGR